ncbi:MAG: aspartate racemase [Oleiphilaceae bacterium]|jgi:aspartate racemase
MTANSEQTKVIGIVGGLGPFAHIQFEVNLLESSARLVGANMDQEFPQWVLSSIPRTPKRQSRRLVGSESPVPALIESINRLGAVYNSSGEVISGADFAVIVCNSAHLYLSEIQPHVQLPILNVVELVSNYISKMHPGCRVGILATTATIESRLYHESLIRYGLTPFSPLDFNTGGEVRQNAVMKAVFGEENADLGFSGGVKNGNQISSRYLNELTDVAAQLVFEKDVDILIAACTELPILLPGPFLEGKPLIDPMALAADASVSLAYNLTSSKDYCWGAIK